MIDKYQHKGKLLVAKLKLSNYHNKYLCRGAIFAQLICISDKLVMTKNPPKVGSKLLHYVHTESRNGSY